MHVCLGCAACVPFPGLYLIDEDLLKEKVDKIWNLKSQPTDARVSAKHFTERSKFTANSWII